MNDMRAFTRSLIDSEACLHSTIVGINAEDAAVDGRLVGSKVGHPQAQDDLIDIDRRDIPEICTRIVDSTGNIDKSRDAVRRILDGNIGNASVVHRRPSDQVACTAVDIFPRSGRLQRDLRLIGVCQNVGMVVEHLFAFGVVGEPDNVNHVIAGNAGTQSIAAGCHRLRSAGVQSCGAGPLHPAFSDIIDK